MIKKGYKVFVATLIILAVFIFLNERNRSYSISGEGGTDSIWTIKEDSGGMLLNSFSPGLNKGVYTLSLEYQNDTGEDVSFNLLDMERNDGKNHLGVTVGEGHLRSGETEAVLTFELPEDSSKIQLEFESKVTVDWWTVNLVKDKYTDGLFLFLLLAGALYVVYFKINWKKPQYAMILIMAGVFITLPFIGEIVNLTSGHDIAFHLSRIQGVADGLRNGQFPVRLNMEINQGYGFAGDMLYPNLFVYPPAILSVLGMSLGAVYKYWILAINIATALVGYYSFSGLLKSDKLGAVCSFLYLINPYRLNNVFLRASIGEVLAAIFLPIFFCGLYQLIYEESGRWKALAVGAFGLLHSHVLTFQISILLGVIFCFMGWRRFCIGGAGRRIIGAVKAVIIVIGLSLWFIIPFLDQFQNKYNLVVWKEMVSERTLYLFQMFMTNFNLTGQSVGNGMSGEMPLTIGPVLLLGSICFLYYAYGAKKIEDRLRRIGSICLFFGVLSCYMASQFFPWNYLLETNEIIYDFLAKMQFPWRMLGFANLFLGVVTVIAFSALYKDQKRGIIYVALGISVFMMTESMDGYLSEGMTSAGSRNMDFLGAANIDYYREDFGENDISIFKEIGEVVVSEPEIPITGFEKKGTDLNFHFQKEPIVGQAIMRLPLYDYGLHRAYINGKEMEIVTGKYGLITLNIPRNVSEGDIEVKYVGRNIYRVGDGLTILFIACFVGRYIWVRKYYKRRRLLS